MSQQLDEPRLTQLPKVLRSTLALHPEEIRVADMPRKDGTKDGIDVGQLVDSLYRARPLHLQSCQLVLPHLGYAPLDRITVSRERRREATLELRLPKRRILGALIPRPAPKLTSCSIKGAEKLVRGMQDGGEVIIKKRRDAMRERVIQEVVGS